MLKAAEAQSALSSLAGPEEFISAYSRFNAVTYDRLARNQAHDGTLDEAIVA